MTGRGSADATALARAGADWLLSTARRVVQLLRLVVIVSALLGLGALALGVAAAGDDGRLAVLVIGVPLFAVPVLVARFAQSTVATVVEGAPRMLSDMNRAIVDPDVRERFARSLSAARADRDASRWSRARTRTRHLFGIRRALRRQHADVRGLWGAVLVLTRIPMALLVVGLGWLVLGLWSAACLVVLLTR